MAKGTKLSLASLGRPLYWVLLILMLIPFKSLWGVEVITAPTALFIGLLFAIVFGTPYPKFNKKLSKYLLQASVVGLGFGMNLQQSLKSGADGMLFTIISVVVVMIAGIWLGRVLKINNKATYLISSGTAICGGSAIAAVGGVMKANEKNMAVSLGVIFILNAIALFIFPPLGHLFNMSDAQFGTWAAIAIHDTSSVVGAGAAYSPEACELATLIKCTRALWIIPLAFFTMWYFRKDIKGGEGKAKISIPWFILLFVVAMVINTYTSDSLSFLKASLYPGIVEAAKQALVAVLFAIGASLSLKVIKEVGAKPLILAVLLWIIIGVSSLFVCLYTIE
ncbi:MAG: putative sulfate exporter family transporter [Bacteroidales bacterium]|nr:putative sulfate exporter family transporter [Bacteroidales bacterium]MDE6237766.1 putative sulfate exporter family transporter [Muribaculaceae bacterium]MDE6865990.1 putative sulfate exporter family transporter [Muribaculaceae bacterium]